MKARIEKKLSKKAVEIAPNIFRGDWCAWICSDETTELAYKQGSCVSNVYYIGGGVDYWGEGEDAYTVWEWVCSNWFYLGGFPPYPEGHEFAYHPDTDGFKSTTRNLLNLLREAERNRGDK